MISEECVGLLRLSQSTIHDTGTRRTKLTESKIQRLETGGRSNRNLVNSGPTTARPLPPARCIGRQKRCELCLGEEPEARQATACSRLWCLSGGAAGQDVGKPTRWRCAPQTVRLDLSNLRIDAVTCSESPQIFWLLLCTIGPRLLTSFATSVLRLASSGHEMSASISEGNSDVGNVYRTSVCDVGAWDGTGGGHNCT